MIVKPGINGEIVPIPRSSATADCNFECWERLGVEATPAVTRLHQQLSFENFANDYHAAQNTRLFESARCFFLSVLFC